MSEVIKIGVNEYCLPITYNADRSALAIEDDAGRYVHADDIASAINELAELRVKYESARFRLAELDDEPRGGK